MDDLYREIIIERYKSPLYHGTLDPHDISFEDENPLCGDKIRIDMRVDKSGKITEAAFSGHGCAISQASADLLLESVIGKTEDEVKALNKQDVLDLLGIELGPVRLKCALLPLKVVKAGVYGVGSSDGLVDDED
jgi:nitrogen fixation protein NifU and related proteins